jgi:hypothetical protein
MKVQLNARAELIKERTRFGGRHDLGESPITARPGQVAVYLNGPGRQPTIFGGTQFRQVFAVSDD